MNDDSILASATRQRVLGLFVAGALLAIAALSMFRSAGAQDSLAVHRAEAAAGQTATLTAARLEAGRKAYEAACIACHQANGQGLPGAFPPLASSDYLKADRKRAINVVVNGLTGPVVVNGVKFNSIMPPMSQLSDAEIADALSYAMNSWGNSFGSVTAAEVALIRSGPRPK